MAGEIETQVKSTYPEKMWEFLRRNPFFRRDAERLVSRTIDSQAFFQEMDSKNPLASYTLRWLFRSPSGDPFAPLRLREYWDRDWSPEDHFDLEFLATDLNVEIVEYLLLREEVKGVIEGPLTLEVSDFCLERSWTETPELFQKYFTWLWNDFEISHDKSGVPFYHHGCIDDWLKRAGQCELNTILKYHSLFAIPRLPLPPKAKGELKKLFKNYLDELPNAAVSSHKELYGTAAQWDRFRELYVKRSYKVTEGLLDYDVSIGRIVKEWIKHQVQRGLKTAKSKDCHRIQSDFEFMESLMLAIYPDFQFVQMVLSSLKCNSLKYLEEHGARAKGQATAKLLCLSPSWVTKRLFPVRSADGREA